MEARDRRGFWCSAKVLQALTLTQHLSLALALTREPNPNPGPSVTLVLTRAKVLETPPPVAGEP